MDVEGQAYDNPPSHQHGSLDTRNSLIFLFHMEWQEWHLQSTHGVYRLRCAATHRTTVAHR